MCKVTLTCALSTKALSDEDCFKWFNLYLMNKCKFVFMFVNDNLWMLTLCHFEACKCNSCLGCKLFNCWWFSEMSQHELSSSILDVDDCFKVIQPMPMLSCWFGKVTRRLCLVHC